MTVAPDPLGRAGAASATFEARLVPLRPQVQRHLRAMVRDDAEAEELTQDTYARAFERIGQLRDPQAALAWLYRIATTVALDRLRQRRPLMVALSGEEAASVADGERPPSLLGSALERSEMSACVEGYLAALPDDAQRLVLESVSSHGHRWKVAELSEIGLAFDPAFFQEWAKDADFGKGWKSIGSYLGVSSFGINASEAATGEELIDAHDEASDGGQEELYVVIEGKARFVCDGEEVSVARGGLLYCPPEVRREARALETPTVVLVIGGTPGKRFVSDLPG